MRRFLFITVLHLVAICYAVVFATSSSLAADQVQYAQGSADAPLTWGHEEQGKYVVVTFRARRSLENLRAVVKNEQTGKSSSFKRAALEDGQEWPIRIRKPSSLTTYQVTFSAEFEEQELNGHYTFRAGPSEGVDFHVHHADFRDGKNELRVVPTAAVVAVDLTATDEQGQQMVQIHRELSADKGDVITLDFDAPRNVLNLQVTLTARDGATRTYVYIPWALETESRGLHFDTGSAAIHPADIPTLQRVYNEVQQAVRDVGQYVQLELYVGGYTDTVGSTSSNQRLSEQRAAAIGRWMKQQGLTVPVYTQGFGENALAVQTADNVEESSNRRAVFILRAGPPPADANFPAANWHRVQ